MPAMQLAQAATDVEPVFGLAVPAAQLVHVACPVALLYLPVAQSAHADAREEPVVGLALPAAHATHAAADVEPVAVL